MRWLFFKGSIFLFSEDHGTHGAMILPSLKTNMTMDNQPFEDVSPVENGDFPLSC